jgi:excisionase family DNA binding protein
MKEKLLTIREAAQYLEVTERQIIDLSEKGVIPAYKVGGVYLRFKKEQLDEARKYIQPSAEDEVIEYSFRDKLRDFLYYNDFYIFSLLSISILIYLIFKV